MESSDRGRDDAIWREVVSGADADLLQPLLVPRDFFNNIGVGSIVFVLVCAIQISVLFREPSLNCNLQCVLHLG